MTIIVIVVIVMQYAITTWLLTVKLNCNKSPTHQHVCMLQKQIMKTLSMFLLIMFIGAVAVNGKICSKLLIKK